MSSISRLFTLLMCAALGLGAAAAMVHWLPAKASIDGPSAAARSAGETSAAPASADTLAKVVFNSVGLSAKSWDESLVEQVAYQGELPVFENVLDDPPTPPAPLAPPIPSQPLASDGLSAPVPAVPATPLAQASSTIPQDELAEPAAAIPSPTATEAVTAAENAVNSSPAPLTLPSQASDPAPLPRDALSASPAMNPPARSPSSTAIASIAPAQSIPEEGDGLLNINIPDTDIREVLELLSRAGNRNILASKSVSGQVKASLTGVDVDTALDAILRSTGYVARREGGFVYVGTPEDFKAMDLAIDRIGTRVYRPNYISAAELQTLITPMLTTGIGTVSVTSSAEVGIAADASSAGGNKFAGAEVVLVRDYECVLAQVDQVFDEVDRRPLQVSIEAMILSVKLTDDLTVGVDWELLRNREHIRLVFGNPLDDLDNMDLANNSGLKIGFLDTNLAAFLDALEKIGETHVISSPRLMCLNKQRAEIHIGEERGYVSTTVTETAATQSVEFLEVGTQLRLRPYISTDGLIRLEIHPELSTGTVEVSENFTLPRKNVTQVTTNVMIRDGATLVIGGLLREDLNMDTSQIPLLGSLPVVGPLFRRKTDKTTRDEVIVLITPRIVWEPKFNCEGEYADCEGHQQHAIMADKMSHISRVHYGRRYRRLAKAAWVAGDAVAALRYINMSIHFNRLDRESTRLRSEIIANSGLGDRTVDSHLHEGLYPWEHPCGANRLENWVLDELHGPHTHLGQQRAPVADPGQPGPRTDVAVPLLIRPQEQIPLPPSQSEPLPAPAPDPIEPEGA